MFIKFKTMVLSLNTRISNVSSVAIMFRTPAVCKQQYFDKRIHLVFIRKKNTVFNLLLMMQR